MSIDRKIYKIQTEALGVLDIAMPYSLEYLTEAHARFGDEFPMDGDALANPYSGATL